MSSPGCRGASTHPICAHGDLRVCILPVSGPLKEARRRGARRRRGGGVGQYSYVRDADSMAGGPPGVKKPYLSTPNDISHVFYPGVYRIRMARSDMRRTYPSAWLTISSCSRWSVLHQAVKGQVTAAAGQDWLPPRHYMRGISLPCL